MTTQILWFATRGAGIVSMLLFTAVVVLGVITTMRWQTERWPRFLTAELHRTVSLLSVVFLVVHILTAILDPFTNLGLAAALVPFASSYRPLWVGLGVVSVYLGVAVVVTSLLRERVGLRLWRAIHWLAYASWPLALLHTIGAGSDATATWMLVVDAACIVPVALAVAWRLIYARGSNRTALASVATPGRGG
ncbi:MAG TPA: ferric reductase-like transmembrane domain-containing protein [Candidatus Dormibacteraeota bacterium]|nr:ferric reductase-like transmembrane domain-containing protein [Candidatus Dormibacteraeota bacterium]